MNNSAQRPQGNNMPPLRVGPGGHGPMGARVNGEKPRNLKKTLGRLLKYILFNRLRFG